MVSAIESVSANAFDAELPKRLVSLALRRGLLAFGTPERPSACRRESASGDHGECRLRGRS